MTQREELAARLTITMEDGAITPRMARALATEALAYIREVLGREKVENAIDKALEHSLVRDATLLKKWLADAILALLEEPKGS